MQNSGILIGSIDRYRIVVQFSALIPQKINFISDPGNNGSSKRCSFYLDEEPYLV